MAGLSSSPNDTTPARPRKSQPPRGEGKRLRLERKSYNKTAQNGRSLGFAMTIAEKPPRIPSAAETDPVKLGWMVGSPPPPDKIVRFADMSHYRFPQTRWSFSNFRQLIPTTNIARGDGPVCVLPRAERNDIDSLTFFPTGAREPMTWAQSLEESYTDAIIVLHRGKVVYERYFGVMTPNTAHMAMSVTKSFFGLLGAMLVEEGRLDERAKVPEYVPELAGSAYRDATV